MMRMKLYHMLVNRHAGIRSRYHRMHDNSGTVAKLLSYPYLLWLNFCYYILQCRFLDKEKGLSYYEEKRLPLECSESAMRAEEGFSIEEMAERLSRYDIISFDIFDTLILRPFSDPADLFYFIGAQLGRLDLKRIRIEQEAAARELCHQEKGHYEVGLDEIWAQMERETGISAQEGIALELSLERRFCYANPFMRKVFEKLREKGRRIIAVSDMYLPEAFLEELLKRSGFTGIEKVYVSCEHGCGKGDGGLFRTVRAQQPEGAGIVHVGDNQDSDVKMAEKYGFHTLYYPNVNKYCSSFRAYDMSPVIGGAYRGVVNGHLYSGLQAFTREYEYGFTYGGLFVLGYCGFIHRYCRENNIDRLLFLARDGDILKQAYDRIYPGEDTVYVYWSRAAAVKLMAPYDRYDYYRRYLYHKVNQGICLKKILEDMELEQLAEKLELYGKEKADGARSGEALTDRNVGLVKEFLQEHFQEIENCYKEQDIAAKQYFTQILSGAGRAAAVDIGWAGSGALSLRFLAEQVWGIPCVITGLVAGTNTLHNAEPDAGEMFLKMGVLKAYLFSQSHNRDVMKKHDPSRDYNVFWELLLVSPTRQFQGFGLDENGGVELRFGEADANQEGIREIQRGILDFIEMYLAHFGEFSYMLDISGRDACAPMLLASAYREKYLRRVSAGFSLEVGI